VTTTLRTTLTGAYFTHEDSIESAALSEPSMVLVPDQRGLQVGERRVALSLRAVGEGHISSIEFRTSVIDAHGQVVMETQSRHALTARRQAPEYDEGIFRNKLIELYAHKDIAAYALDALPNPFALDQLEAMISEVDRSHGPSSAATHATRTLHWLASSNYDSTAHMRSTSCATAHRAWRALQGAAHRSASCYPCEPTSRT